MRISKKAGKETKEFWSKLGDKSRAAGKADEIESRLNNLSKAQRARVLSALDKLADDNKTRSVAKSERSSPIPDKPEAPLSQKEKENRMRAAGKTMELVHHASKLNDPVIDRSLKTIKKRLEGHIDKHYDDVT